MALSFEFKIVTGASKRKTAMIGRAISRALRQIEETLVGIGIDNQVSLQAMIDPKEPTTHTRYSTEDRKDETTC